MKRFAIAAFTALMTLSAAAQTEYKGTFNNMEYGLRMKMNLEKMDVPVPGMEDLDSCYGWIQGRLNGAWYLLKVKEKTEKKAVVRAVSERGADAQDLEIKLTPLGLEMKLIGGTYIKGVDKNKYVKLPKPLVMEKE